MDMKKLCSDADTVLELLYNTYYDHVCTDDTDEIKQAFDDLYNVLSDKSLKEKDAISTCRSQKDWKPRKDLVKHFRRTEEVHLVIFWIIWTG